ncbi:MAG: hypothetical protein QOE72_379 [Chloroflexota bacterium]|nr:hypothetical protein [Chloroflexota bacterium]
MIVEGRRVNFARRGATVRGWHGTLSGLRVDPLLIQLTLGDDVEHVVRYPVTSGGAKLWIGITPVGRTQRFGFLDVRDTPSGHSRLRLSVPVPPDSELWMYEGRASTAENEPFVVLTAITFRVAIAAAAAAPASEDG